MTLTFSLSFTQPMEISLLPPSFLQNFFAEDNQWITSTQFQQSSFDIHLTQPYLIHTFSLHTYDLPNLKHLTLWTVFSFLKHFTSLDSEIPLFPRHLSIFPCVFLFLSLNLKCWCPLGIYPGSFSFIHILDFNYPVFQAHITSGLNSNHLAKFLPVIPLDLFENS